MKYSKRWFFFWVAIYTLTLIFYALWSFSLTDPNLVLTSWPPYWQFQNWMWQTFFHHANLLSLSYVFLVTLASIAWYGTISHLPKVATARQMLVLTACISAPLFFSYNALSHDVFNYIFNAKMVTTYQVDPHVRVALEFAEDPWTRFMHNTHTPAPYGYGWTAFSLLPSALGMGKFLPTWLIFRAINYVSLLLLFVTLLKFAAAYKIPFSLFRAVAFFLHPLVLIEVLGNMHNDFWMVLPLFASFVLLKWFPRRLSLALSLSSLLFLFSVSTKLVTIVLLPIYVLAIWGRVRNEFPALPKLLRRILDLTWYVVISNIGLISSVLLFIPLLTARSQFFHPWYLLWSLVWLPFITARWWRTWLLMLSFSSLLRYVPWLIAGGFSPEIIKQQQTVTWLGAVLSYSLWFIWNQRSMSGRRL